MKTRLLLILALVCAVIAASITGTLSVHTVSEDYVASVVPDTEKILDGQTKAPMSETAGGGTRETASETFGR